MDINLARVGKASALLIISLILTTTLAIADPSTSDTPLSYDTLIQNADASIANDEYSDAFSDELSAIRLDPSRSQGLTHILTALTQQTPNNISVAALSAIPANTLPFDIMTAKTEAGSSNSDDQTIILVPHNPLQQEIDDPVQNWPFGMALYVYSTDGGDNARLICTVHYEMPEIASMAQRVGWLIALLDKAYAERMEIPRADDSYPFHVWLCATAPISNGGEQWRNNIYFYDISDERSSIEWIREIAHEFSHLAFPAVGGTYTSPEAFANGYLGERLLVRWLSRGTAGGAVSVEAAWKGTFAGYYNFNRLLIQPSLSEFDQFGLNKNKLAERDAEGMRYMIGMMLTVDDQCGSAEVGTLLQGLANQHSSDPNLLYGPVHSALASNRAKAN